MFKSITVGIMSAAFAGFAAPPAYSLDDNAPPPAEEAFSPMSRSLRLFASDDLYQAIRSLESQIPVPPPKTVLVGTLDAEAREWSGYEGIMVPTGANPPFRYIPPLAVVKALEVTLEFRVANRGTSPCRVTVDGRPKSFPLGASSVAVSIAKKRRVHFKVQCGLAFHEDDLRISHDVHGIGAFQTAAWPIALVYEPPTNLDGTNMQRTTHRAQVSSTLSISSKSEDATTRDSTPVTFQSLDRLQSFIATAKLGGLRHVSTGLEVIEGILGSVNEQLSEVTSVSDENSIEMTLDEMLSYYTTADLGPGRGDVLVYAKNARFAWTLSGGQPAITLIGFEELVPHDVAGLKAEYDAIAAEPGVLGPSTGLDRETLQALLSIDPMVFGSAAVSLPPERFEFQVTVSPSGAGTAHSISHTITSANRAATTKVVSTVTDSHPSWLAALGISFGVGESGKTMTSYTLGSARADRSVNSVSSEYQLTARPGEIYSVNIYFDSIFQTFVFQAAQQP